jgi:hypothetical protein
MSSNETRVSNAEVEKAAIEVVRDYFRRRDEVLTPVGTNAGYDFRSSPHLNLYIEVKGFTGDNWFNLSRLADRGYGLAEEFGESYQLHVVQFRTAQLDERDCVHWLIIGQDVSRIYNTQRTSWEATGDVGTRMNEFAVRVNDANG